MVRPGLAAGGLVAVAAALASVPAAAGDDGVIGGAPMPDQPATLMVVVGAPGTSEYAERFAGWADRWKQLGARAGARFLGIGLGASGATAAAPGTAPATDRQLLAEALAREAQEDPNPRGPLWLVLLGHGTFDGRTARLNLRGPDVAAEELAAWLKPLHRPLVVIDATSASGPFVKALSGPDRVIVTATRSGREVNVTRLAGFLLDALGDAPADLDKDGQTSLLEAFLVASRRTEAAFAEAGLLATEHALLDDNGDGLGTDAAFYQGLRPAPRPSSSASAPPLDGQRAHQIYLLRGSPESSLSDDLRRRRDHLEQEVSKLRGARPRLSDDDYYRRLEPLLLEIARMYRRAERR
jgi:hypothetical protein